MLAISKREICSLYYIHYAVEYPLTKTAHIRLNLCLSPHSKLVSRGRPLSLLLSARAGEDKKERGWPPETNYKLVG